MDRDRSDKSISGIPKQAFEQFLEALKKNEKIPPDVIDRLSETLIDRGQFSNADIRAALFPDNDSET